MEPQADLAPEVVVGARYRLVEQLARGATSSVWRAHDVERDRAVALKILRSDGVDPALRLRAEREAAVLTDLTHPNLVRVLDHGVDEDRPFLVMELLEGESLDRVITRRGPIPHDEAVRLVADVADGLSVAHAHGVVHRDVKPANIVCAGETPTLVDFGIARAVDATTLTRGLVLGTASYLAPEQAQARSLTPAADVYALGCVLYELLTGHPPFEGSSPINVALRHVQDDPVPPGDLVDVPPAVDEVTLRCLAKDPAMRPADGAALAADLRAARGADPSDETAAIAIPIVERTAVLPALSPETSIPVPPPRERKRRPRTRVALAGAGLAIVVVAFGLTGLVDRDARRAVDRVPDVTNAPVDDALTYLSNAGLDATITAVPFDGPPGIVLVTEPAAGQPIAAGATVEVIVSDGPPPEPAPVEDEEDDDGGEGNGRGKGKKRGDD